MKTRSPSLSERRCGVALITVLGLLALLAIMALTFATITQLDRKASIRSYDHTKAQLMVPMTARQVLRNIESGPKNYFRFATKGRFYPDLPTDSPTDHYDEILVSSGGGTAVSQGEWDTLRGKINSGIPEIDNTAGKRCSFLMGEDLAQLNTVPPGMQWVDMFEVDPTSGTLTTTKIGEFAYLAVNASGRLDEKDHMMSGAGALPGPLNRPFNPYVPQSLQDGDRLVVPDFSTAYQAYKHGTFRNTAWSTDVNPVLHKYIEKDNPRVIGKIDISSLAKINANETEIKAAFRDICKLDGTVDFLPAGANTEADVAYNALKEFVDANNSEDIYTYEDGPQLEKHPMFSEFGIRVRLTKFEADTPNTGTNTWTWQVVVLGEIAYPFEAPQGSYTVECDWQFQVNGPGVTPGTTKSHSPSVAYTPTANSHTAVDLSDPGWTFQTVGRHAEQHDFTVTGFIRNPELKSGSDVVDGLAPAWDKIDFTTPMDALCAQFWNVGERANPGDAGALKVQYTSDGTKLSAAIPCAASVPVYALADASTVNQEFPPAANPHAGYRRTMTALDPRFNWHQDHWYSFACRPPNNSESSDRSAATGGQGWFGNKLDAGDTLGAPNKLANGLATSTTWKDHVDTDTGTRVSYVRNGPLENVGELGFIPYNEHRTIQTSKRPRFSRIWDIFTLDDAPVRRGLFNPNSEVQIPDPGGGHRLASSYYFEGKKIADSPDGTGHTLNRGNADTLAQAMRASVTEHGGFGNPSDIVDRPTFCASDASLGDALARTLGTTLSENERESLYANTFDRFNTRNNLFWVLLLVRPTGGNAVQHSFVGIWRDPFPNQLGATLAQGEINYFTAGPPVDPTRVD